MPLHLLGKKSWNVYNADNIARVRRDEAAAAAEELAAEQRMQDADAARRLAILRGETPPPLPEAEQPDDPTDKKHTRRGREGDRLGSRKRKRGGEDDTDFEMRVARERAEEGARVAGELAGGTMAGPVSKKQKGDVDIVDKSGHIDLVGPPPVGAGGEKNAEYEREAARKKREVEDQYTMRFANAAGRDVLASDAPWYANAGRRQAGATNFFDAAAAAAAIPARREDREAEMGMEAPTKNVWGRDDPKRRDRETSRLSSNDPLAAMKMGARKVRDIAKERRREAEERERELKELRRDERRREKRRRRDKAHADEDEDEEGSLSRSHRSQRPERRHHGDEGHERRHVHRDDAHGEERRRRREVERDGHREKDRHHGRERERSRERGTSTRSHRDKDDSHRRH
ncbi:hypothetical protein N8I77_003623 [Diaporthe amygdali]|uniref:CBF1-interacting co-repressor CIR N-terminal domain-containing protein n=1 Tax=Phomopsis amygdali TaxID=1214568 RepID=A0AAD9SIC4_PHOAM|nr:hypothetical protein N8I77_003623 [Diaporthe amygdali]